MANRPVKILMRGPATADQMRRQAIEVQNDGARMFGKSADNFQTANESVSDFIGQALQVMLKARKSYVRWPSSAEQCEE